MRWLLSLVLALLLRPAFAGDLVGVELGSATIQASGSFGASCIPGAQEVTLAQGETVIVDVGCGVIAFELAANQLLAGLAERGPPGSRAQYRILNYEFLMPNFGQATTALVFEGLASCFFSDGDGHGLPESLVEARPPIQDLRSTARLLTVALPGDQVVGSRNGGPECDATSDTRAGLSVWTTELSAQQAACADDLDNDGDGAIDLADKQCKNAADDSESQGGL